MKLVARHDDNNAYKCLFVYNFGLLAVRSFKILPWVIYEELFM